MRFPSVRFTVRGLMLAVALTALAAAGWRYWDGHRRRILLFTMPQVGQMTGNVTLWFDLRDPADRLRCRQAEAWLRKRGIGYRGEYRVNEPRPDEMPYSR
jgi:hypothetical protein